MSRTPVVVFRVLDFIKTYKEEHDGNSPTYEMISEQFGWSSSNTAYWHVSRLERKGLVKVDDTRRITLPGGEYIPPENN